jgi:drug/metabolite transporter (DMT)-like permease
MTKLAPWLAISGVLILTIYAQVVIKMRVSAVGHPALGGASLVSFFLRVLLDPWTISAFVAAFVAGLLWMIAMTRLPLSVAYPFISVTIVGVTLASSLLLGETVKPLQIAATGFIIVGLVMIGVAGA